jgi:hypothetical protein
MGVRLERRRSVKMLLTLASFLVLSAAVGSTYLEQGRDAVRKLS